MALSIENFIAMSKLDLANLLAVRGFSSTGKKKAELVALAYSSVVLGIEKKACQAELATTFEGEYSSRLRKVGLEVDPRRVKNEENIDNVPIYVLK